MSKPKAVWVECAGVTNDGDYGHSMRDFCSSCAPYWAEFPICPTNHVLQTKLKESGYCKKCKKFYDVRRGIADFVKRIG